MRVLRSELQIAAAAERKLISGTSKDFNARDEFLGFDFIVVAISLRTHRAKDTYASITIFFSSQ